MELSLLGDDTADSRHFPILDFTQEEHGDMQVFGLDPFHFGAGSGKRLLESNGTVADIFADVYANEGA
jgi:hypothetical protein